ncbi:DUF167 domain-containing protein [Nitrosospira sp. NRS527]|uniref:DUF167 domain-containing protein n=1 Tax=Nitrosospira sp. NRS527 TaxID=155925 RepID=UPI001AF3140C|nr:DUF167 domain-containing protein [Nitrosospira sp. NRS527]BCT66999.1 hypothetical protein NNRS527_00574 [Nitrosospira sp. NRS527]
MPGIPSSTWYRCDSGGQRLTLTLHVQPGAKQTEAVGLHGDAMKIRLAAPPVEGAANAALVEFLAGIFGVRQCQVTLKHGIKSRRKVVEISHPLRDPSVLWKCARNADTD